MAESMLRDLRVKVRNRHSRISSCGYLEFLALSKQFFAFVNSSPTLKSIISELLARNPASTQEARTADPNVQVYGETAEQAATIAYEKWSRYAAQDTAHGFYTHAVSTGSGQFDDGLELYRDWYVEPLFDYLDEVLEDANVILATLVRYKHKVEWYRRQEVAQLYAGDTSRGERHLARHMYEYLFDQGLPFHVEPQAASGRPDVVSLEESNEPFIGDAKVFDAVNRGAPYIKKGLYQVYRYCWDYNSPVGYLIVFNTSDKQLRFTLPSGADGVPRFEYNNKTIFIVVIDIHPHAGTASTLGTPETVTVVGEDLVREREYEASRGEDMT
jgi:hypothetical protein